MAVRDDPFTHYTIHPIPLRRDLETGRLQQLVSIWRTFTTAVRRDLRSSLDVRLF
jgi:hypothetical protein